MNSNLYKSLKLIAKLYWKRTPRRFIIREAEDKASLSRIFRLRYNVYCLEKGYLKKEGYPNKLEQDKFDLFSKHFVILDKNVNNDLIGTVRVIFPSELDLPIINNFVFFDDYKFLIKEKCVELSRLIVKKEYRFKYLHLDLLRLVYKLVKRSNFRYVYAVMDDGLYLPMKKMGVNFVQIGKKQVYQGNTRPYVLDVDEMEKSLLYSNALLYKYFKFIN